jgi:hypothetical protein
LLKDIYMPDLAYADYSLALAKAIQDPREFSVLDQLS